SSQTSTSMRVTLLSSLASFASLSSVWVRNLSVSSVCRPFTTTSTPPPPRVRPVCGCSPDGSAPKAPWGVPLSGNRRAPRGGRDRGQVRDHVTSSPPTCRQGRRHRYDDRRISGPRGERLPERLGERGSERPPQPDDAVLLVGEQKGPRRACIGGHCVRLREA